VGDSFEEKDDDQNPTLPVPVGSRRVFAAPVAGATNPRGQLEMKQADWLTWERAETLDEWVVRMVLEKRTKEADFQAALRYFGRTKFEQIWLQYLERTKEKEKDAVDRSVAPTDPPGQ
jgi:hypothetical protein